MSELRYMHNTYWLRTFFVSPFFIVCSHYKMSQVVPTASEMNDAPSVATTHSAIYQYVCVVKHKLHTRE